MMTCEQMIEWYGEFADGRVPFTTSMSMRMHLAICGHCRRYYAQTKQVVTLTAEHREALALNGDTELLSGVTRDVVFSAFRRRRVG